MKKNCCSSNEENHRLTHRDDKDKKEIRDRLSRIKGQLDGISKMIDEDRYCGDILIQLSSAQKALLALSNKIIDRHMHTCLVDDIKNDKEGAIDELFDLIKKFQ